jgi:molecular chaperone DnaK
MGTPGRNSKIASNIIGIDLGTSRCCVAAMQDGKARVVPDAAGSASTPSAVGFTPLGDVVVGAEAVRQAAQNPAATVYGVKRLLGRKYHSPAVKWLRDVSTIELVAGSNGDTWVRVDGEDKSPQEITGYLIEHVVAQASATIGRKVTGAVIAVPAFFDDAQRRSVFDACALAGLHQVRLISDTMAAALAHGLGHGTSRVAVVDLGAGCFDISIIEESPGELHVAATNGDTMLGGHDLDRRLVGHLVEEFHARHGVDLSDTPDALWRIHNSATLARHQLTKSERTRIVLEGLVEAPGGSLDLTRVLTRRELEELVSVELDDIGDPCAYTLQDIERGTDDIDLVLLSGGLTRMPAVRDAVEYLFGSKPERVVHGGQAVAIGAAMAASIEAGELDLKIREATPHSLGIKVRGGRFNPVLMRNRDVPCVERKSFNAARPDQTHMLLEVYQGESEQVVDNAYLGRCVVHGMKPGVPLVVEFAFDRDGLMQISTVDNGTLTEMELQRSGGLSVKQVEEIISQRQARSARGKEVTAFAPATPTAVTAPPASAPGERETGRIPVSTMPTLEAARPPQLPRTPSHAPGARSVSIRPPRADRGATMPPPGPLEVATDSLVGTVLGDRYLIEAIVADGGMGRVYRARHKLLNRVFAIKVLHAELAAQDELADRFVREAQAAASIDNEHVVNISDFGRLPDGTGYFVMEYLEGRTLAELLHERGALDGSLIKDIGLQLADGLSSAHEIGIVHRDLKPANVTLIKRKASPHFCKIVDFGIAKSATSDGDKDLTQVGMLVGTPHYMAPEQIDGVVDTRSDIYALGVVLYELATGVPPFDSDSLVGVLVKHKCDAPPAVHQHEAAAEISPELEAVILKCLEKDPDERYQGAAELAAALTAVHV